MNICDKNCDKNYDLSIRVGESLELSGRTDDDTVDNVVLKVWNRDGLKLTSPETKFIDGVVTIDAGKITLEPGEYNYSLTVTYKDGKVDILPDSETCTGVNCSFPKLVVCDGGR